MKRRPTSILTTLAVSVLALTLIAPWALGQDLAALTEIRRQAEQGDADAQVRAPCLDSQFLSEPADEFERAFDVQFDRNANGASFSCDIFVRASEADRALNRFRRGVLYESRDDLNASVTFPITVAVYDTLGVGIPIDIFKLENADDFISFKRSEFDDALIGLISCANTINVMIRKSRTYGFAIGLGVIWFQPVVDVHPVKVTRISVRPIPKEWVADRCSIYYSDFPETN